MKTEIRWCEGSRFNVSAKKAHDELEKLRKKHGGEIEPANVVEVARSKRNPLHPEFEWDDAVAAQKHREERARSLIRSIVVTYERAPAVKARAYEITKAPPIEDRGEIRKVYRSTEDVLADPEARNALLMRAIRELASFQERYHGLSELAKVFAAAEAVYQKAASS